MPSRDGSTGSPSDGAVYYSTTPADEALYRPRSSCPQKKAKADAKAAKARAKSLRPWYRKKRFILVIAIVAIIVIAIASNASKKSSSPTSSGPTPTVAGVNQGAGSADASGDVSGATLGQPDALCIWGSTLTVTNHSSKRSNYLIELAIRHPRTVQLSTTRRSLRSTT